MEKRPINSDTINANILKLSGGVRGPIYIAAKEMTLRGQAVTLMNVGNPHALGQKPLSFIREVLALFTAPHLLENTLVNSMFASDVIERARYYLNGVTGGVGAYSDSKGSLFIREIIANFFEQRDGLPADPEDIFMTNGASEAVQILIKAIIRHETDAILAPIPQYPLYSGSIALHGGTLVGYSLNESSTWGLHMHELERALNEARDQGLLVRAMVLINPGNPTGQCLEREDIQNIIRFCCEHGLLLFADEVYQTNVYLDTREFISCRSVLREMGEPYLSTLQMASFHTISKGVHGECGIRGGFMQLQNFDKSLVSNLFKLASLNLSPNIPGQVVAAMMVDPPKIGDNSYENYENERRELFESLVRRAQFVTQTFNALPGIECQETQGAMYAFPRIFLPPRAVEEANLEGMKPDEFYCLKLLIETGLCTVPGSGFGQEDGTFHFRTTILPPEDRFPELMERFSNFHRDFMAKYSDDSNL